ncbi:MAG: hypothetical protein JWO05_2487 [Gemmatimonadetes bacterium]|nr:hypothetical protein [Gemmatimonadota bacterium]
MKKTILSLFALSGATAPLGAQALPPIRQLGAVVAKTTEKFGNVSGVRQLPNGSLLVNDPSGRKVVMLDASLGSPRVIADSTSETANAYSGRIAGLVPYRGDSTLFVDPQSLSMLVIDPSGKIGRVMSVPRPEDASTLAGLQGMPGFDSQGRLIYRAGFRFSPPPRTANGVFSPPEFPDSSAILRIDLASRKVDTLAWMKIPKIRMNMTTDADGRTTMSSEINPLPLVDDWAVLTDGTLMLLRGRDYHADIVRPDGTQQSVAKMPFDWQRLTDEDKIAFIDSVKAQRARLATQQGPGQTIVSGGGPTTAFGGGGQGAGGGAPQMVIRMGDGGGPGGPGGAPRAAGGPNGAGAPQAQVNFVSPSELPDYKPPFFAGSTRADADGNAWVRTIPTKAYPGGPIYDVINGKGELVDRVQVPAGRSIIGFGKGGVVYLSFRDGATVTLEKASAR